MTTLVRILRKGQMTLPSELRTVAGVEEGDYVEASVQRGKIVLTPMLVVDRSGFPSAADEYTKAQRKAVDRGIARSRKEYKRGKAFGPFASAGEMVAELNRQARRSRGKVPKHRAA